VPGLPAARGLTTALLRPRRLAGAGAGTAALQRIETPCVHQVDKGPIPLARCPAAYPVDGRLACYYSSPGFQFLACQLASSRHPGRRACIQHARGTRHCAPSSLAPGSGAPPTCLTHACPGAMHRRRPPPWPVSALSLATAAYGGLAQLLAPHLAPHPALLRRTPALAGGRISLARAPAHALILWRRPHPASLYFPSPITSAIVARPTLSSPVKP
jgi:hypothetical protein